jgi:hypothetical protein
LGKKFEQEVELNFKNAIQVDLNIEMVVCDNVKKIFDFPPPPSRNFSGKIV